MLAERRNILDDVETIAAYAQDMSESLKDTELSERRAIIETFVKEIVVTLAGALMRYSVPMPDDTTRQGGRAEELVLNGAVLSTVQSGGPTCTVASTYLGALAGRPRTA